MLKRPLFFFPFLFFLVIVVGGLGFFVKKHFSSSSQTSSKMTVVTSFYPLADFAQHIGQDKVEVINLTPAGAEPHDFEPTPQDLVKLQKANVFVYNGVGLEMWLDKIGDDVKKNVVMVNASQGITILQGKDDDTNQTTQDPHVWMDPVLAQKEVENIKNGLVAADPKNKDTYEKNATEYEQQLVDLDVQMKTGLANCQIHDIVTSHNAFQYLGKRYGLNVLAVSGLSPDAEPSPKKLAEVVQFSQEHHVKYIFFETLVSPKLSQTIAQEAGAQTIVFNPLEGLSNEELAEGKNYISVQKENLSALRTALMCQ